MVAPYDAKLSHGAETVNRECGTKDVTGSGDLGIVVIANPSLDSEEQSECQEWNRHRLHTKTAGQVPPRHHAARYHGSISG